MIDEPLVDGIIEIGRELVTPAVKTEIEETWTSFGKKGKEGMVTRPSVIRRALEIADLRQEARRDTLAEESLDAVGLRGDDEEQLVANQDLKGNADETLVHLGKEGGPVGGGMRPRKLHTALRVPLGGEEGGANLGLLGACLMSKLEVKGEVANR
jgi:hypothetical protein